MEPAHPAQRAHLRRVFDALGDPTFLLSVEPGPRYVIVAANQRGQQLIGRDEDELVGLGVDELMPPATLEETIAWYDEVVRTLEPRTRDVTDGSGANAVALRIALSPVIDEGNCTHILAMVTDISSEHSAVARARTVEDRFEALVRHSTDITLVFGEDGRVEYVSPSITKVLGYAPEELVGTNMFDFVHPDDLEDALTGIADIAQAPDAPVGPRALPVRVRHRDGSWVAIEGTTTDMRDHDAVGGFVANIRDVSERNDALQALRQSEVLFRSLAECAPIGITIADTTGKITYVNERFKEIFRDDFSGWRDWMEVVHPDDRDGVQAAAAHALEERKEFSHAYRILTPSGDVKWLHVRALALREPDGSSVGTVGIVEDVTERKEFEAHLAHQSTHDPLTGLPNRILFEDRLEQALVRDRRVKAGTAVLFLDLDLFKLANDRFGHAAGDGLLVEVAQRLRACVRVGDTVARIGGDEFATVCEGADESEAEEIAERILAASAEPFVVEGTDVFLTASIGIAVADPSTDVQALMRQADAAMYRAKHGGRGRSVRYHPALEREVSQLELAGALRRALERDELVVYYQPIIDLVTDELSHFEALVRWNHPTRGLLYPTDFIDVAEHTGLIVPLGNDVLDKACRQLASWQRAGEVGADVRVSVNVSANQLDQPDFVRGVTETLERTGLTPEALQLEITESTLVRDPADTLQKLQQLEAMGIRLAVDDFGTGYASLQQLKSLPIKVVKIDRSFVMGLGHDSDDEAIVSATIRMAHELGLAVTAEGVETAQQLQCLREMDCDDVQGFLFAPALPPEEAVDR